VEGLTEEEKEAYCQQNAALLESDFVPAYQLLIDGLTALRAPAPTIRVYADFPGERNIINILFIPPQAPPTPL